MLYYKIMGTDQIVMCVVALILGMLLANMLKNVCGCKVVEGFGAKGAACDTQSLSIDCGFGLACKSGSPTPTCQKSDWRDSTGVGGE
jgi:hypothetical protein